MSGLSCQYEYRNFIKWWHVLFSITFSGLCFQQLLSCGRSKILHKHQWMYWPNLLCPFRYSVGASMGQPGTRWSMVSGCLSNTLHFGSKLFSKMFAWKFLVGRLWSCATTHSQISDPRKLATDWLVKNLYQGL